MRHQIIPKSVLQLLAKEWEPREESLFEKIFEKEQRRRERGEHTVYVHRVSDGASDFSFSEARRLNAESALGGLSRDSNDEVRISEHAEHALIDFCCEVYDAWRRLAARLEEIEQAMGPLKSKR